MLLAGRLRMHVTRRGVVRCLNSTKFFVACCLRPWLSSPLATLWYVMYFRYNGWRHVCHETVRQTRRCSAYSLYLKWLISCCLWLPCFHWKWSEQKPRKILETQPFYFRSSCQMFRQLEVRSTATTKQVLQGCTEACTEKFVWFRTTYDER